MNLVESHSISNIWKSLFESLRSNLGLKLLLEFCLDAQEIFLVWFRQIIVDEIPIFLQIFDKNILVAYLLHPIYPLDEM